MSGAGRPKIVLLGMMTKIPVAGVAWVTAQYLVGLQRLGYDVYYVEQHRSAPRELMESDANDGSTAAAEYIDRVMRRFDLGDQWSYQALHADGRYYGMSQARLKQVFDSAELIINLHGATTPLPEHYATNRLIYLETDPVEVQVKLDAGDELTTEFLSRHAAYFSWGLNYGRPDCLLPTFEPFPYHASPPPVVLDFWYPPQAGPGMTFTTIGNWRQYQPPITFRGDVYHWSKHLEFLKFLDLPSRTDQKFELALSTYHETVPPRLERHGWTVRPAAPLSSNLDAYRAYIAGSRGEFTVAKDQNVRLRSGWFSERSAAYLASGRPVITQETGFSNILPTGEGLFGFQTMEEIVAAVEKINGDYQRHSQAAYQIARDYFSHDVVLERLLADVGL